MWGRDRRGRLSARRGLRPTSAGREFVAGAPPLSAGVDASWAGLLSDPGVILMDRPADAQEIEAICRTLLEAPGVAGIHDLRTRTMGDSILVDVHIDVDADLTVEQGHDIALDAGGRVLRRHRVLSVSTHVDPFRAARVQSHAGD